MASRSKFVQTKGAVTTPLLAELRSLIEQARQQVAQAANSALTLLYWQVGDRIRSEVLSEGRAAYGKEIFATVSQELVQSYGKGFSASALSRMVQFSEAFRDQQLVATLAQQLSWSHFVEILPLSEALERDFYAEMCRIERWSVRTLRERIGSQLYLRTAIAKRPEAVISAELEKFAPAHKGQMELYLRWLDRHERAEGEAQPIGLILCASADAAQVELLDMDSANIRVAKYTKQLPDRQVLQAHLHRAVALARARQGGKLQDQAQGDKRHGD